MKSSLSRDVSGFEAAAYLAINCARWRVAEVVLDSLEAIGRGSSRAHDFGSGPGWFARDFGLGFGILYHLENRIGALRILRALTSGVALIETMTFPSSQSFACIVHEDDNATQGVRDLAIILGPTAIEQAHWAAGFPHISRHRGDVAHPDFANGPERRRRLPMFLAADESVSISDFVETGVGDVQRADHWKISR